MIFEPRPFVGCSWSVGDDSVFACLLVGSDEIVQRVEGVLHYNAREKKSLCDGSSINGSGTGARSQSTVYREHERRIIRHRSLSSTSLSFPTDVSTEKRRLDPVHAD